MTCVATQAKTAATPPTAASPNVKGAAGSYRREV